MPVVYRCSHCGRVLYVHWRVGQNSYGVPTPSEIIARNGGVCPYCGHRLGRPSIDDIEDVEDRALVKMHVEALRQELELEDRSVFVSARLPAEFVRNLDLLAERLGVSRSEVLCLAVARLMGESNA